ncbi:MAG: hypothetical protein HC845_08050 [Akkermansiaceae bacterium]|nr:hypothetical protein [Akkermansiaceae bacterium]
MKYLIGQKVASVLRNFPYPVTRKIFDLPAIACVQTGSLLVVMATQKNFIESLWTVYSWMATHPDDGISPRIYIDGDVTESMQRELDSILPGTLLCTAISVIEAFGKFSSEEMHFFRNDRYGRKLGLLLALNDTDGFIFQTMISFLQ